MSDLSWKLHEDSIDAFVRNVAIKQTDKQTNKQTSKQTAMET